MICVFKSISLTNYVIKNLILLWDRAIILIYTLFYIKIHTFWKTQFLRKENFYRFETREWQMELSFSQISQRMKKFRYRFKKILYNLHQPNVSFLPQIDYFSVLLISVSEQMSHPAILSKGIVGDLYLCSFVWYKPVPSASIVFSECITSVSLEVSAYANRRVKLTACYSNAVNCGTSFRTIHLD